MAKTTTIKLDNPITVNGAELGSVEVRSPKVRDMLAARKVSKDEAQIELTLIANLTMLAPADIEELDFGDYAKIQEALKGFFG